MTVNMIIFIKIEFINKYNRMTVNMIIIYNL